MTQVAAFEAFDTVYAAFRARVADAPDAPAILFEGCELSFADLAGRSERLASGLLADGVACGDRVAWWGKNHSDFVALMIACARIGAVLAVVNWRLAEREVATILADATPRRLFVTAEFGDAAGAQAIVAGDDGSWADAAPPAAWPPVDPQAPFLQLYTSGTTGLPKGVPQSHINHLATYRAWAHSGFGIWNSADRCLISLPVFHAIGSNFCLYALLQEASVHLLREFSPAAMADALAGGRITRMPLVPTMIDMLTRDPAVAAIDHRALRTIVYGGSSIPRSVLDRGLAVFGCDFAQCYAATETTAAATCLAPADHVGDDAPLASCGRAMAGIELRIVDSDGAPVPDGTVGEIALRGASIMAGYWNRPEETAQVLRDGWYTSGDAGVRDATGLVTIVDRTRDMMISGGENVYPSEVEMALRAHPAIADVAVVGVPDERWGQRITAAIVASPDAGSPTLEAVRAFLDPLIARYKHPRQLLVMDTLPRNPTGKILRAPLIDQATEEWGRDTVAQGG